jgi:hypothetical protein
MFTKQMIAYMQSNSNYQWTERRPGVVGICVRLESARIYNFKGIRWRNRRFCRTTKIPKCPVFQELPLAESHFLAWSSVAPDKVLGAAFYAWIINESRGFDRPEAEGTDPR